jgi:hypothetical protein
MSETMATGLEAIFLRVAPSDIAYVKFVLESYEGVAVVRTLDRHDAVIVVLVVDDFRTIARSILQCLRRDVEFVEIPPPADACEDWLLRVLWRTP